MADLKPIGSEKLTGDEKLKRILELTYYNEKNKKSSSAKPELVKESKSGAFYGIVKERDVYYVKSGVNESSLDYIGGMFMKNKNRFNSYGEALKRLELVKGQDELQEATKYVLKQNKPQEESPAPAPSMDAPSSDIPAPAPVDDFSDEGEADFGGDSPSSAPSSDVPAEEPSSDEMGDTESKRSDYMAEVQKYAGKLGQELRDLHDKMESDDIKYVLNMIISAVDLDKLDLDDIEEIAKKFERDEEEEDVDFGGDSETEPSAEDEVPSEEPKPESDLDEYDSMSALESFIDSPVNLGDESNDEVDLSKYAVTDGDADEDVQELDLDEIKNEINRSVGETLMKYFK
jgi:hypothetical protein